MTRLSTAVLALAAITAIAAVTPGAAAVTPTKDALLLAQAIAGHPAFIVGAEIETAPPSGHTAAVSEDTLAAFLTSSQAPSFAILSTGDLGTPNADPASSQLARASDDLGGGAVRGGSERDVTTLRLDIRVPAGASCLQLDFRFLSEEWPDYRPSDGPGSTFNDAFIAELDVSNWTTSGDLVIADTFAYTTQELPVTLVTSGPFMSADNAVGTTYNGAGPIRQAWTAVTPGQHSVFLSIFDSIDGQQDSAVFLDQLVYGTVEVDADGEEFCAPGPTLVTQTFADAPQSSVGELNGYRILIETVGEASKQGEEPPAEPLDETFVQAIMNSLAPGFRYIPGSTTGATTADPASPAEGQLVWEEPFEAGLKDGLELHFAVAVPKRPGTYRNSASVKAAGYFLLPSSVSAPIEVVKTGADLVVTYTQAPLPAIVGAKLTLSFTASNRGPLTATGVVLEATLPGGLAGTTVTTTQGSCDDGDVLVCKLDRLAPDATATVTVVGVLESAGGRAVTVSASALELDPEPGNNKLSDEATLVAPLGVADTPVEPVVGKIVKTKVRRGDVRVRAPDALQFVELDETTAIPVGSTIDARKGEVTITSAVDKAGTPQTASFAGAQFVVRQKKGGLTVLRLVGGDRSKCRPRSARATQRFIKDGARGRRVIRRMWGRGKGRFRTRGRYASATVRGTVWRTIDRCDGTLIRVKRGVVVVRDVNRKRAVAVKAGHQYLVKKPKFVKKSKLAKKPG